MPCTKGDRDTGDGGMGMMSLAHRNSPGAPPSITLALPPHRHGPAAAAQRASQGSGEGGGSGGATPPLTPASVAGL